MARRYKKVDGGHGHHGGAWKVAYADFVTAMMALFMVLWLLATTDSASRKEISNYFRSGILPEGDMAMNHAAQIKPSVIEEASTPPPSEQESSMMSEKQNAAKQISDKLGRLAALDDEMASVIKNVKIKITPEGVLIETVDEGDNLLFDVSSSKLNEPLQRFLKALAPMIVKVGHPVEINGHTDARQFASGSKLNNWDLSYQRAASARQILEQNGVPSSQVTGVFARASSQLYDPANPLAAHNRRLSFLLRINGTDDKVQRVDQIGTSDTQEPVTAPEPPKADAPKTDAQEPAAKEPAATPSDAKPGAKPADAHAHK
ncbi:MAG TPA: flagellar motor protein MotB [Kofleriaceae bacterium]|jgi:chemotaxis protein MotB